MMPSPLRTVKMLQSSTLRKVPDRKLDLVITWWMGEGVKNVPINPIKIIWKNKNLEKRETFTQTSF